MVTDVKVREVSPLRHLHDTQVSLEKFRIALGNRCSALSRGVDEAARPVPEVYERLHQMATDMEKEIDVAIAAELDKWPVYRSWLSHVKGIGPSLAGQMLALLLPPIPSKGPSSWYKAAGLAPELRPDGLTRLPRPSRVRCPECSSTTFQQKQGEKTCTECGRPLAKGEGKVSYHPWLRRCLYNVGTSFVRNGGYYRVIYEQTKERLQHLHEGDKDWPPIRVDRTARWKMVKVFLAHLWEAWSEVEGIPARLPYVVETYGHQYIPRPLPTGDGKI